jgi:site-specific recombinase XerD
VAERRHTKQRRLIPDTDPRPRRAVPTRQIINPAPAPAPAVPPRPHGNLDTADAEQIIAIADQVWPRVQRERRYDRGRGLRRLLELLAASPGETWQQRWLASGYDVGDRPVRELADSDWARGELTHSLMLLCCLRVIRPTLAAFRGNHFVRYHEHFEPAQADPQLDEFVRLVQAEDTSPHYQRRARFDVAGALTSQGIAFADLTAEAFLHYATETRANHFGRGYELYVGHLAWKVLHQSGHFPPAVPATLRGAMREPAMTPAELVAQHGIRNPDARQMLTAYLTRRSHDIDYATLRCLATDLCGNFWAEIERINPEQNDLALSEETYQAWRVALGTRRDGKPRLGADAIVTSVRALYLDIQGWAIQEPGQWACWSATCPISSRDVKARAKARRRTKERMDNRTRILQPLLPALVAAVEARRDHMSRLLAAATTAEAGHMITIDERRYRRILSAGDARHQRIHGWHNVRVHDEQTGRALNVTLTEDTTFWEWACIETLHHTGARCEEMLELSQLSIRQYVRPNGEVIALLVIAPSKTDRERVIPITAELFHVLACIIRRLTRDRPAIPLATRYDKAEHVTSEPQPFLFQRTLGQRTEVITPGALREMLFRLCASLADTHPQLATVRFTPHDFRRLLATDLANHGLPIHIGAALLGHLNLQTFHGYVAVFPEDVIRHYQAHLANRRAGRSAGEYRPVTNAEWAEFEQHFDKRKVELGHCGRPYATSCEHEHSCIRCPMLRVDPKMIGRLDEIHADLLGHREHAQTQGWLGEIEGIDLTLRFLADKRAETVRLAEVGQDNVTPLGMPRLGAPR